ncbi:MAG: PD-(D/E)XK nuclease family protein [Clostridia bacterium]|nr:PD-(D/E)XK nuclease family protein [Clostridia bacterium]
MLHFIYGRAGSGKTPLVCQRASESLAAGRRTFLLVPEQQAVDAEQRMADLLGDRPQLGLEVLNFKRLCNRLFREYGGLSYNYITKSGRSLLMWQALNELAPMLRRWTPGQRDLSMVQTLLSAVSECKAYCVTPQALEASMKKLGGSQPALADKLSDLSLIYANYIALVRESRDDASDDLTKAAALLQNHSFFAGSDVYLDSYNGFTPQEFALIGQIMAQAENVTIALCHDNSSDELFVNLLDTTARIKRIAARIGCPFDETLLRGNHRAKHDDLRFLEQNLWSLNLRREDGFNEIPGHISLIECPNLFAECEAVAIDISRRVREGASWRDFTITTRGLERYDGIIDVMLEKYGIPHFLSRRTDITAKPLIKLILAALSMPASGIRTADMISYLKTGLLPLDGDEILAVENYAEAWSVRGGMWFVEWRMNPLGFTAEMTEKSAAELTRLNEIRARIAAPLHKFHEALASAKTVRSFSEALYAFLLALEIPAKLTAQAEALRHENPAEADELAQLWSLLIDALDKLCATVPSLECDVELYVKLLHLLFANIDIGRIPSTIDEVTVGDASLLRATGRHVYVLGVNEGIFPLAPSGDSIFSDDERAALASVGLELAGGGDYRAADERFTFYRALSSATDSVTLLWSRADLSGHSMKPSLGVTRLRSLFPKLATLDFGSLPASERLHPATLMELLAETSGTPLGEALRRYAAEDSNLSARLAKLDIPLTQGDVQLNAETSRLIAGGDLALTQSRLDAYVLCHFSYFCKYVLKLNENKPARFDAADIGTFVHHILEMFVARAEPGELTDEALDRMVEEIVSSYMTDICRISPEFTGSRLNHLFARLKRSSRLLCRNLADEFSQSSFTPAFFELPIRFSAPDEAAVDPLEIDLHDGSSAYIYGIADRVDTLTKDGKFYVRVVDYKTGSKDFSMEDIALGLDLQMLLYLFSLWKNGSKPGSALHVPEGSEILPAGVLYFPAHVPTVTLDAEASPDEVERMVSDKLSRRGLLLDDGDVLRAMERELSGRYLPIKVKKDGSFSKSDALRSLEDFGGLLHSIEDTVREIGLEIKRGNASARPMRTKAHDACKYCKMKPICRKSDR